MTPSIHGHDVLALLEEEGARYTRDTYLQAINARFGAAARFHTCSAASMTAEELLRFLEFRGKFHEADGHLCRTPNASCEH